MANLNRFRLRRGNPGADRLFAVTFAALALATLVPVAVLRGMDGRLDGLSRLLVAIDVIALPAAVAVFAEHFGRSRWLAVFAFPLAWNVALGRGDLLFATALPFMLLAIRAIDLSVGRAADPSDGRPAASRFIAALAPLLLAFFLHPVPFLVALVVGALVVVARGRAGIAACALGAAATVAFLDLRLVHATWQRIGISLEKGSGADPPLDALHELHRRVIITWPERGDDLVLMGLALAWLLVAGVAAERVRDDDAAGGRLRALIPEAGFVLAAVAYFLVPRRFDFFGDMRLQLLPIAALFGATLARGPIAGWRRALLLPAILAALVYPIQLAGRPFPVGVARPAALGGAP